MKFRDNWYRCTWPRDKPWVVKPGSFRVIMIRTWIGPLPPWTDAFFEHHQRLHEFGWDFLLIHDYDFLAGRCWDELGVRLAPYDQLAGSRKAGDLDPTYGVLFADILSGYDYWGHTGLDCVYGRLDRWLTEEYLSGLDVFGNDPGAICGPFSLYRNCDRINRLFFGCPSWKQEIEEPVITAFDEKTFSAHVATLGRRGDIRFETAFHQSHDKQRGHFPRPRLESREDGSLIDKVTNKEIMMFHFNRKRDNSPFQGRTWPL